MKIDSIKNENLIISDQVIIANEFNKYFLSNGQSKAEAIPEVETNNYLLTYHSCMPSPLALDPIRVQPCVCGLFRTNRNSMTVTYIFLSISLSNYRYESYNRHYQ